MGADLVTRDLILDVVLQQVSEPLVVAVGEAAELFGQLLLVEEIAHADAAASHLGAVGWADALPGGADEARAQFYLLQAIDHLVEIEDDVGAVADENALLGVEAMLLESLELLEERGDVDDTAGADEVDALRVDETGGQDVEVVGDTVGDDGVTSVVTALGAAADLGLGAEDVDKLALALITPLRTANNGGGHGGDQQRKKSIEGGVLATRAEKQRRSQTSDGGRGRDFEVGDPRLGAGAPRRIRPLRLGLAVPLASFSSRHLLHYHRRHHCPTLLTSVCVLIGSLSAHIQMVSSCNAHVDMFRSARHAARESGNQ